MQNIDWGYYIHRLALRTILINVGIAHLEQMQRMKQQLVKADFVIVDFPNDDKLV